MAMRLSLVQVVPSIRADLERDPLPDKIVQAIDAGWAAARGGMFLKFWH
jgi:hypothetical protein